ncbi:MAG: hypothetical protein L3K09_06430 [Thermoplasmata archaeon]|nr:hypothetical protein [Thermoplasmata archaeon]
MSRRRTDEPSEEDWDFKKVVPPRAVLTELCRGFLLVNEVDRERATRFAKGFLRERAGEPAPRPVVGVPHLPTMRRGPRPAPWEPPSSRPVEL